MRRLHVRYGLGRVRRDDLSRRLLHPGQGPDVRRGARDLAREDRVREAGDRRRLPSRRHRPAGGRDARGARAHARRGRHELQALHGLQGRDHGRRRDALPGHADRRRHGRARDGARRARGLHRRPRQAGARRGQDRPDLARAHAPARDRGRGDEPGGSARARGRLRPLRRPRLLQGVDRPDRARQGARLERARRDLHAVLLRGRDVPRAARLRGREVRLHAAPAREGEPGAPLARGRHGRPLGDLDRPLPVRLGRPEVARAATTSPRSRTAGRGSRTG